MSLNEKDKIAIKEEIFQLAAETEQYDFPFFSNIEKRKAIIQDRKREIDERMLGMLVMRHIDVPSLFLDESLWEEAKKEAKGKFESLSEEKIVNGFYFQELMHVYVSNNIRLLDESWYFEINSSRNLGE